jgi:hypothetical protein
MLGLAPETMLPEKYRRLWRRRLRRRPLLPFLLAATLAIDLVLHFVPIDWEKESLGGAVLLGFLAHQLGLLGTWITHARRGLLSRLGMSVVLLTLALLSMGSIPFRDPSNAKGVIEFFELVSSGIVQAIVFITMFASAIATGSVQFAHRLLDRRLANHSNRRFTIASLLWITLVITLLLGFGRYAAWDSFSQISVVLFVLADAFAVAVVVALAKRFQQWPWRHLLIFFTPLAGVVGLGALVLANNQKTVMLLPFYYAVQCLLYGVWFYLLAIGVNYCRNDRAAEVTPSDPIVTVDLSA